jgi:pimeloyl-ACP methyl ester carboxylesterase
MSGFRAILAALALAGLAGAQEHVSFATEDGGTVYADLYGKGSRGLVLAHGGQFNKESWAKQTPVFVAAGFRVLAIDFRGYGQSRAGTAGGDGTRFDVLAAVRYLRKHGAKAVSIVGASFGGSAAAEASIKSKPGEIDRIVLLGASIKASEKVKGRKLYIVARDDVSGDGPRLPKIRASYEKAREPKELIILDGSAHAQFLFETDQGERVMREILRFLQAP